MDKHYDTSWNLHEDESGNLPENEDAFEKKYAEWQKRSWEPWLRSHLKFPFPIERVEDEDDAYFTDIAKTEPFRLGHVMDAIALEMEDDFHGIILKVQEGDAIGHVPLADVEVTSKENDNYWPVREYVVWFADR